MEVGGVTILTVQQWTSIIKNSKVTKAKDLRLLKAYYSGENHGRSAREAALILHPNDPDYDKKDSAQLAYYAKRIEKKGRIPISLPEYKYGGFRYYDLFFIGASRDASHKWFLRPNLVAALQETDQNMYEQRKTYLPKVAPLNQILYGPPGTGKTYSTIARAVAIANPAFEQRGAGREAVRQEYQRLVDLKRITFTTFHQSLSYEDFVEGLKPRLTEATSEIKYHVKPGIFKDISVRAKEAMSSSFFDFEDKFNVFTAQVTQRLSSGKNYGGLKTKTHAPYSITKIDEESIWVHPENGKSTSVVKLGVEALSKVYELLPELRTAPNFSSVINDKVGAFGFNGSYYYAVATEIDNISLPIDNQTNHKPKATKNFVLIIDEINRGNISAILGEMITLLEKDKRLSNDEELTVVLPYSRDEFGVPPNLYIIGTMNTADRSVESLDAALRRRFVFEEVRPDPQVIRDVAENGGVLKLDTRSVSLATLLEVLNHRIAALRDNDHQLGHSYFLKVNTWEDLAAAMADRVVPLLREYFFANYAQLQLIVGQGFCRSEAAKGLTFAAADGDAGIETSELRTYRFPRPQSAAELEEFLTQLGYPWDEPS